MKKTIFLFITISSSISLTGCLQMFPPTVADMGQGVYNLNAQSNAFGSRSELRAKLERKAQEVCKGKGFEEVNQVNGTKYDTIFNSGIFVPVSTKSSSLIIRCKD
ncbi:hypothetical protein [Acinetobacter sp. Marseille-Q1618]|uniref:hypothetical protein n=1 Tax=Acinetobacter sp. Marseille-Q1618 TaxID=2697502 RepID=UPI001570B949|nr:hypothetical protein [Acinetobacter sp. Marseille-Q1618]